MQSQDISSLLCGKDALLAHVQLGVHQDPRVLFCQAVFQLVGPQPCMGFFLPTLHLPLLNCMAFLSALFSSLLRSLWMAAQPSGVLLPALCHQQTYWGYIFFHHPGH